LPYHKMIL